MNTITLRSAAALSVVIAGATLAGCAQNTTPDESAERAARESLVAYQDVAERRAWMRESRTATDPVADPYQDQAERRQPEASPDPSEPPGTGYLDQAERRLRQLQAVEGTGH